MKYFVHSIILFVTLASCSIKAMDGTSGRKEILSFEMQNQYAKNATAQKALAAIMRTLFSLKNGAQVSVVSNVENQISKQTLFDMFSALTCTTSDNKTYVFDITNFIKKAQKPFKGSFEKKEYYQNKIRTHKSTIDAYQSQIDIYEGQIDFYQNEIRIHESRSNSSQEIEGCKNQIAAYQDEIEGYKKNIKDLREALAANRSNIANGSQIVSPQPTTDVTGLQEEIKRLKIQSQKNFVQKYYRTSMAVMGLVGMTAGLTLPSLRQLIFSYFLK
jgi:chromosome segregation ATPase